MASLAIDRFSLPPRLEAEAQRLAAELRIDPKYGVQYPMLVGYLSASVAVALERPRWKSRDRLAVDLRTVQLLGRDRPR